MTNELKIQLNEMRCRKKTII